MRRDVPWVLRTANAPAVSCRRFEFCRSSTRFAAFTNSSCASSSRPSYNNRHTDSASRATAVQFSTLQRLEVQPVAYPQPLCQNQGDLQIRLGTESTLHHCKSGMEFEQFKMTLADFFSMPVEVAFSISYRDMEGDDVALRPEADMSLLYEMADAVPHALRVTMCKP